jgi:predicted acetyltransferase
MMVATEVVPVLSTEVGILRNLFQFYEYDFSEIEPAAVGADGCFHQLEGVRFEHAYFIRADGELAGFALVNRKASRIVRDETVWWMEEFFIMRRYRRGSVGRTAARLVLDRHPGTWEVTQTPSNGAAIAFWRTVFARYGGEELHYDDPKWGRRPLQRVTSS